MLAELPALVDLLHALKQGLPLIISLIIIEGLLSVDNALAIAALASHLNEKQQRIAMNIGYLGAYGFRVLALIFAAHIATIEWVLFLGSVFLIWLMCDHFSDVEEETPEGGAVHVRTRSFANTIAMIAFMDLSLSVDNVVAAVGLSRDKMIYVYIGVTIGIITLRIVAGFAVKMIKRFPDLEHAAFLLVGYVGALLLAELLMHEHFDKIIKFTGIAVILALSMAWSRFPAGLKKTLRPVTGLGLWLMKLISTLVEAAFLPITWPFRKLMAAIKGKPAPDDP